MKVVLLNGVPLLLLAALYGALGIESLRTFWRERAGSSLLDWSYALLFPAASVAAAIVGIEVIVTQETLGSSPYALLAAVVVAALPPLALLSRRGATPALRTLGRA